MNYRRISQVLNRILGGRGEQTLCARMAERHGVNCRFCRLMERLIEPSHCLIELAKWQRRGTSVQHVGMRRVRP